MRYFNLFLLLFCVLSQPPLALAEGFDLQGHRGARGLLPENTLPAFAKALSIGVSTLEMDVGVTKNGRLVVSHDPFLSPNLTRDRNGNWLNGKGPALFSLTLDEIATYNVGRLRPESRYAGRFPDQTPEDSARIPSLEQVFDLVRASGQSDVRFNIETKIDPNAPDVTPDPPTFAALLVQALNEAGFTDRASIQSFDWRTLKEVQRIAPHIPTVFLTAQQSWLDNIQAGRPGPSPWTAGSDVDDFGSLQVMLKSIGAKVWSPYWRDLTSATLAEAQNLGLSVVVWTVNSTKDMTRLIDMGVDGIISDYPDRLQRVLHEKGFALKPDSPFYYRNP